jgi:two-component system, OmpR family, sensor kinase
VSGTASARAEPSGPAAGPARDGWDVLLFAAWAVFTALCVAVMLVLPDVGAVAFHFVWISMAIVYGVQGWSAWLTAGVLAVVVPVTGLAMASFVAAEGADWMELTEVPLMALVFLAMVWHVRRRQSALAASQAAVVREHRANEVKELFVRHCSHQMRTPITVARGYAELARKQVGPAGQQDLDVVVDELDKLAGLAGRLLMLADVYESRFEWDAVDVGALVRRTAARWRPTTDRRWLVEAGPVVVEADEGRLEAALDSLVENAIKFSADGDTIVLRCRPSGRGVLLEVEDSGIGFDRSGAPDAPRTSGRPGTGLGLAIVRGVVEGHGGTLVVEPRSPGSLVRITLPEAVPQAEQAASAPAPPPSPRPDPSPGADPERSGVSR